MRFGRGFSDLERPDEDCNQRGLFRCLTVCCRSSNRLVAFQRMVVGRHACSAFAQPPSKSCQAASSSLGDIAGEARDKRALLDSLVHPNSGFASLSIALGHDASVFGLPRPKSRFFEKLRG